MRMLHSYSSFLRPTFGRRQIQSSWRSRISLGSVRKARRYISVEGEREGKSGLKGKYRDVAAGAVGVWADREKPETEPLGPDGRGLRLVDIGCSRRR